MSGVSEATTPRIRAAGPDAAHWALGLIGLLTAAIGAWATIRYPLHAGLTLSLFVLLTAAFGWLGPRWPLLLLGLWPVAGYADWSAWLLVEEGDLLLSACVAGWCLRRAWPVSAPALSSIPSSGPAAWGLDFGLLVRAFVPLSLLALTAGISWARQGGWTDAAWKMEWASNYHQPQAALRMLKPYLWVGVLALMWVADHVAHPRTMGRRITWGFTLGLITCGGAVVVERLTYTGLTDFSSDYRATGSFWEMHVGGAALDAYLALALPLAALSVRTARRPMEWVAAGAALALGGYAVIATFSRATYAAAAVGVVLALVLGRWASRRGEAAGLQRGADPAPDRDVVEHSGSAAEKGMGAWAGVASFGLAVVGAAMVFPMGGYRGALAWLCCVMLMPSVVTDLRIGPSGPLRPSVGLLAALSVVGVLLGLLLNELAPLLPKGPYLVFGGLLLSVAALQALRWTGMGAAQWGLERALLSAVMWIALVICSCGVTIHWAAGLSTPAVWIVHVALLGVALLSARIAVAFWPGVPRWHLQVGLGLCVVPLLVGMAMGGAYMQNRAASSGKDLDYRKFHWNQSLSILRTPDDRLLGKGLSRFPQEYRLVMTASPQMVKPGHHEVGRAEGQPALKLLGSEPTLGFGEQHRVLQRVPSVAGQPGPYTFEALAWAPQRAVTLVAELCGRHLLYVQGCRQTAVVVPPSPGPAWVPVRLKLTEETAAWPQGLWAPSPVLALTQHSGSAPLWIRSVRLLDANGQDHVENGDFALGLQRWFFSSDMSHLPWSAKNMGVHLLVEQGWFGVGAWTLVALAALAAAWRGVLGGSQTQAALIGSMAGMALVAGIDSMVNHTRTLTAMMVVLLLALMLPSRPRAAVQRRSSGHASRRYRRYPRSDHRAA